jgi:hypothetical protein
VPEPQGDVVIGADEFERVPERDLLILTGSPSVTRGMDRLTADRIEYQPMAHQVTASGHVVITLGTDVVRADSATYNLDTREGRATQVNTIADQVLVSAANLYIYPEGWIGTDAHLTSCTTDPPHWELSARQVEIIPNERFTARRAGFSLFGQRLVTVAQVGRPIGRRGAEQGARRLTQILPTVGYDNRDGLYLQETTTLLRRRNLLTTLNARLGTLQGARGALEVARPGKVSAVAAISRLEDAPNQRAPFLEYSRLPEAGLVYTTTIGGTAPPAASVSQFLPMHVGQINALGTPQTGDLWRFGAELTAGYFQQERGRSSLPGNLNANGSRLMMQAQVARARLRLGPIMLDSLRLLLRQSLYDTGDSFTVAGAGIGKHWKLGPLRLSIERLNSYTIGHTPFLFDNVELNSEWRPGAILRTGEWEFSWIGRFDEARTGFYDHLLAITRHMDCMEPRVGFSTRLGQFTFDLRLIGLDRGSRQPARPAATPEPTGEGDSGLSTPDRRARRGRAR